MKAIEFLKLVDFIPGMPWGISIHIGRNLREVAEESNHEIIEGRRLLDDNANYLVIWDSLKLREFLNLMPATDIIIQGGCTKKYLWELEN